MGTLEGWLDCRTETSEDRAIREEADATAKQPGVSVDDRSAGTGPRASRTASARQFLLLRDSRMERDYHRSLEQDRVGRLWRRAAARADDRERVDL